MTATTTLTPAQRAIADQVGVVIVREIKSAIARLEASRRCWPGLDSEQEEYVAAEIGTLRDELIEIEEGRS